MLALRLATGALVAASLVAAEPAAADVVRLTGDERAGRPDIAVDASGTAHVVWDRHVGREHVLVYCRVPRGARACASTRSFPLPGVDGALGSAHVILMPRGELVVTTTRSFAGTRRLPDTRVYAIVSTDAGASFTEPRAIGEYTFLPEVAGVAAGPGDFSVSLAFTDGTYAAAPLDALSTMRATLGPPLTRTSVGLANVTSPVVVYSRSNQISFRSWQGPGTYDEAANWTPDRGVGAGSSPLLAGGPRGLYLLSEHRGTGSTRLEVRRFKAGDFDEARLVSSDGTIQFGDFHQDAGGTLHALFWDGRGRLNHRVSVDGLTWKPSEVLVAAARGRWARVAAAADGGGAAVLADDGIKLARFGASGGGGDTVCVPSVTVGVVVVRALEGCLARDRSRYTTGGPVKVNGVDVEGSSSLTVDTDKRTLETRGEASVRAGGILLDRAELAWKLPAGEGKLQRLGVADGSVFRDLGRFAKRLFSFPVEGDAELRVASGATALIDTSFRMPALLGGVTGAVTLRTTDQRGLVLDGFTIKVPEARIGKLRIAAIEVVYESDPDVFKGSAQVYLPPAYRAPLTVTFGLREGRLNLLHTDIRFPQPFPIVGVAPEPVVGLDRVAFDYRDEAGSRTFEGSVDLQGGPTVGGLFRVTELLGKVTLTFPPEPQPASIDATGTLQVVGIPFATGHIRYTTDNVFSFDGTFAFPPPGKWQGIAKIDATVAGFLALRDSYPFSAAGHANATVAEVSGTGDAVISSRGVTGCVSFPKIPNPIPGLPDIGLPDLGVSYRWGDDFPTLACNVGEFKIEPPGAAQAAQTGRTVSIPAGLRQAALEIAGGVSAPRVRVTGPDGSSVISGPEPVLASRFVAQELAEARKTYVAIGDPPPGTYTIAPVPGSAPIARVALARGLPDPAVRVEATGRGGSRTLRYRVRKLEGQRIVFVEQSARGLYRELARTTRASGVVRFRPARSGDRSRQIVALVEQNGYPRARLQVARFTAPPQQRLARPRRVTLRRRGSNLVVRWSAVQGARGYEARIDLPRDGRRVLRSTRRRTLTIGGVERNDTATVRVRSIDDRADPGRARTARLRPR